MVDRQRDTSGEAAPAQGISAWGSRLAALAQLSALFFLQLAFLGFIVASGRSGIYNSDLIHPFLLLQDLLRDPASLVDWYYSPAVYAFPDWLLSGLLVLLPLSSSLLPLIYGALLLTLYSLAGGWLAAAVRLSTFWTATWSVAALLILLGTVAYLLDRALNPMIADMLFMPYIHTGAILSPLIFGMLLAPYIHTGAILVTLLAAALLLTLLQGRGGRLAGAALLLFVFGAAFSDLLFVAWFVGPAVVLALLYGWAARTRRGFVWAGAVGGTALLAVLAEMLSRGRVLARSLDPADSVAASLALFFRDLGASLVQGDLPVFLVLALTLALLLRAVFLLAVALRRRDLPPPALLELFLAGSAASALIAAFGTGAYSLVVHWRYVLILFLLPPLWAALRLVPPLLPARGRGRAWTLALGLLAAMAAFVPVAHRAVGELLAPTGLEACLLAEGRREGLGDYWTAKLLMLMSDRQIHIVQVLPNGDFQDWNVNRRWFHTRADNGAPLAPDFIVLQNLDAEALQRRFGPPDRTIDCDGRAIWLYDSPLRL